MEFAIREHIIIEVVTLAQTDQPEGMFMVCLDFIISLATNIKSMPIIHNDRVHRSLLQLAKCIQHSIKNDIYDINDPDELNQYSRSILDFMRLITDLACNRDPETARFFIEEASQYGRARGTQTYVPLMVLIEYLKKESISQGPNFKRMLRDLLVDQLKIDHSKVRRFITIDSDFALNLLAKLQLYLDCIPEEV